MILPKADFEICFSKDFGLYFNSLVVDLDKNPLVCPILYNGTTGTIEFHRKYVILNPANSVSKKFTISEFVKILENM